MAKTDLSAAVSLVQQRPDVKYSNIGNIVRELTQMGFDPKTAKMAVMMVFQEGPEVNYLKSAGVTALQSAKVMFNTNIDLGQILDALLEMGYTREDASNAIDMLNTDEGSQSVTQHTDVSEGDDNAFADYADPGYKYDDLPPQALEEVIKHAEADRDNFDSSSIRGILDKYNVSSQTIQQLINELFGKQSKVSASYPIPFQLPPKARGITRKKTGVPKDFGRIKRMAWSLGFKDISNAIYQFNYVDDKTDPRWAEWLEEVKNEMKRRIVDVLGPESGEKEYQRRFSIVMSNNPKKLTYTPLVKQQDNINPISSIKTSVELSWRELGLTLQDKGIPQDQIIEELKREGASDEEAHAASLPREQGAPQTDDGEYPAADLDGMGAPSDDPEDLEMGPSGDFPYGAGMGDEDGPGGINDSLEGAPGPNDFDATGGGFIGGPEDTEDGQYFTEGQDSGQAPEMGSGQDAGYWNGRGQDFVSNDPQMTKTDLVQILQNEGASEEEANQVAENLELEDDPAISPGTIVRASGNTGEVTGIWDTLYGKMASVKLENGGEYEFPLEDIKRVEQDKLATTRDELLEKIAEHLSGDWYDALETLPTDYRNTYSERIKAATKLQREVHNRISTTKDVGEMGLLGEAKVALANEIVFCQTRLASADFVGEEEYVNSLPKYEFGKDAALGSGFGPGGGESIVLIAAEMEEELEATDWNEFSRIASVEFVSEVSPSLIGDAQEVARLATVYVSPKVSMLSPEKALEVANDFLANVEKVRRSFAIQMRTADVDKEAAGKCKDCGGEGYKKDASGDVYCKGCYESQFESPQHQQAEEAKGEWNKIVKERHKKRQGLDDMEEWKYAKDSTLFETIDEIDDMQEEAEDEEETPKKKKSNTEISDEGWLL